MIYPSMYIGIGFLFASLVWLLFAPLVHNRAERLTRKRLESVTKLSIFELSAHKDHVRAEYAVGTVKLESHINSLKSQIARKHVEISMLSNSLKRLKIQLEEKDQTIVIMKEIERGLREHIRVIEEDLTDKTAYFDIVASELAAKHKAF